MRGAIERSWAKDGSPLGGPRDELVEKTGTSARIVPIEDVGAGPSVACPEILGIDFEAQTSGGHAIGPCREDAQEVLQHREGDPSVLTSGLGGCVPGLLENRIMRESRRPLEEAGSKEGRTGVWDFGAVGGRLNEPA